MFNYTGRVCYGPDVLNVPPPVSPSLITGVGRMKFRKPGKAKSNHKQKRKARLAMAKKSRRRNV